MLDHEVSILLSESHYREVNQLGSFRVLGHTISCCWRLTMRIPFDKAATVVTQNLVILRSIFVTVFRCILLWLVQGGGGLCSKTHDIGSIIE